MQPIYLIEDYLIKGRRQIYVILSVLCIKYNIFIKITQ